MSNLTLSQHCAMTDKIRQIPSPSPLHACRSCLDAEAPPSLTAAAAALAGGFVEAGLAGSDPLLLTRLMGQLVNLLQTRSSKQQQLYSEWVPLQAHLALLQAHAQFATAGAAVLDAESIQVVQSAQQPHYRCAPFHMLTS